MFLLHISLSSQLSCYIEEPYGSCTYIMHICQTASRLRPHHPEHTRPRPISEAKQGWAWLVLGLETAWEYQMQNAFSLPPACLLLQRLITL